MIDLNDSEATEDVQDYIFRGRLDDCFRHFAEAMSRIFPKGSVKVYQARKPLGEFCGVNSHTASDWILRGANLEGIKWFRMAFFLQIQGYGVTDLDRIGEVTRNFAALIVFGLLTVDEAQRLLNYEQLKNLYRILRGENKLPDDKSQIMWNIWKERKNDLFLKMNEARQKYYIPELSKVEKRDKRSEIPLKETTPIYAGEVKAVLDIMRGLKGLLDTRPFDKLSEREFETAIRGSRAEILQLYHYLSDLSVRIVDARSIRDGD